MKHGFKNSRKIGIILLLGSLLFLTGYIFYKPELINAKDSFIDLKGGIKSSLEHAEIIYAKNNPVPTPHPTPKPTLKPTPRPTPVEKVDTVVTISVSDMSIKIGKTDCANVDEFRDVVQDDEFNDKTFLLVDDFAEYRTYKQVLGILNDMGKVFQTTEIEK